MGLKMSRSDKYLVIKSGPGNGEYRAGGIGEGFTQAADKKGLSSIGPRDNVQAMKPGNRPHDLISGGC